MDTVFTCETSIPSVFLNRGKIVCDQIASHVYGPECEAQTGQLMYLCASHATQIELWRAAHPNDPVECPEHGHIGKVKDYLILKRMN